MVGSSDIISHYNKIGYNTNVLQQTACLVVIAVAVRNFVFLLIARRRIEPQTLWRFRFKDLSIDERVRAYAMPVVRPAGNYVFVFCFFGVFFFVFFILCTVESLSLLYLFLYVNLYMYVLADDQSISKGSFMRTKHLFVLIYIRNKGEVDTVKHA